MNYIKKYYYEKFSVENIEIDNFQNIKLEKIVCGEKYGEFFTEDSLNYCIIYKNNLAGTFSLTINDNSVELLCLYIFKECRNRSIGTYVLNDIIFLARHNLHEDIKYMVVNSFVDSSMFFLKKGFDFCKINKKLDYKKKNVIKLYKRI